MCGLCMYRINSAGRTMKQSLNFLEQSKICIDHYKIAILELIMS